MLRTSNAQKSKAEQISITLPGDLKVKIDARARGMGIGRSGMIALALEAHFREERVIAAVKNIAQRSAGDGAEGLPNYIEAGQLAALNAAIAEGFARLEESLEAQRIATNGARDAARRAPEIVLEGVARHAERINEQLKSSADDYAKLYTRLSEIWGSMPRVTSALASVVSHFGIKISSEHNSK